MTTPRRVQRQRTKGWRMPAEAIYVGRPTKFGNPFPVGRYMTAQMAVDRYRHAVENGWSQVPQSSDVSALRGHDLACWCPLDQPCHADVLLELANQ